MRCAAIIVVFLACATATVSAADEQKPATNPAATAEAQVPVKTVVLFSSGVGYFEHFGSVTGDNRTELRFKTEQINDILKSLVLQDLDGGKVTTVTYGSHDPLAKTLKSFQVDITANPTLFDLLNQLRGAKIILGQASEKTTGTILGVEKQKKPVGDKGQTIEESVLNLITEHGLIAIPLASVSSIIFDDPQLQAELEAALSALNQARDQDKKPVQIRFEGAGQRRVRVGYVVQTPIWKTSYRLVLGAEAKPKLQGWAIVENQTDNDWNNVQLSLVSGRPISFVQDLYQPLYLARPVVQPELYAGLTGQRYDEGMTMAEARAPGPSAMPTRAKAPAAAAPPATGTWANTLGGTSGAKLDLDNDRINPTASVASLASATKIGELFQYTVGDVSLPRQKSAMLPIITDDVEIEKLSIYNASVLPKNPLNGARLKNTTGKHLLAGPITVFDANSYAGDAQIENLPPGQDRLISYGIDLQVLVDATKNRTDNALQTGRIVNGVLELKRRHVATQEYAAENKSDAEKTLLFEHAIRPDWKLVDTEKPAETTPTLYRFTQKIGAGKSGKLVVKEEIVQSETLALLPTDLDQLIYYSRAGEIPDDVKKALTKAISMRQTLAATQRKLDERKARYAETSAQQTRTAEVLKNLQQNTPVYQRLVSKLNDQQTEMDKLQTEVEELTKTVEQQRTDLEAELKTMNAG